MTNLKDKAKATEDKIKEEAKRIEKKTGIPYKIVIGLGFLALLAILAKLGVL